MIEVDLTGAVLGASLPPLFLRDLRGEDELLDLAGPCHLVRLVDRLVVAADGESDPARRAGALTLAEFDRASAALFAALYGDTIACHIRCDRCGEHFEVSFSLADFIASVEENARADPGERADGPDDAGIYRLAGGARFRLPTVCDLVAASASARPADVLRERCLLAAPDNVSLDTVDGAMAALAPLMETEIDNTCVACGTVVVTPFSIADFLVSTLQRERPIILREVHALARAYAWSRQDILTMPRDVRREHVRLVLADAEPEGWQ